MTAATFAEAFAHMNTGRDVKDRNGNRYRRIGDHLKVNSGDGWDIAFPTWHQLSGPWELVVPPKPSPILRCSACECGFIFGPEGVTVEEGYEPCVECAAVLAWKPTAPQPSPGAECDCPPDMPSLRHCPHAQEAARLDRDPAPKASEGASLGEVAFNASLFKGCDWSRLEGTLNRKSWDAIAAAVVAAVHRKLTPEEVAAISRAYRGAYVTLVEDIVADADEIRARVGGGRGDATRVLA